MFYLLPTIIHFYENVPKVHKTFYTLLLTAPNPPTCKRSSHNISMVITTNIIILIIIIIRGGVRLRSRLSPEGGPIQKWYFRVKSGTVFINSCVLEAYNMKSYKKLDQVTISANHYIYNGEFDQNSNNLRKVGIFSKNAIFVWFS